MEYIRSCDVPPPPSRIKGPAPDTPVVPAQQRPFIAASKNQAAVRRGISEPVWQSMNALSDSIKKARTMNLAGQLFSLGIHQLIRGDSGSHCFYSPTLAAVLRDPATFPEFESLSDWERKSACENLRYVCGAFPHSIEFGREHRDDPAVKLVRCYDRFYFFWKAHASAADYYLRLCAAAESGCDTSAAALSAWRLSVSLGSRHDPDGVLKAEPFPDLHPGAQQWAAPFCHSIDTGFGLEVLVFDRSACLNALAVFTRPGNAIRRVSLY